MAILGIDIGGTKTALVLGEPDGEVLHRYEFKTNSQAGQTVFADEIVHAAAVLKSHHSGITFDEVSISVGGPLDEEQGILISPPHLEGLHSLNLSKFFKEIFQVPVYWMHDAKSTAFAEYRFGAGKGKAVSKLMHLTFATGFGCGFILNGRPLDIPGEIGHWRVAESGPDLFGKTGSLEGHASGAGILMKAQSHDELKSFTTISDLANEARNGNSAAREIFHDAAVEAGIICAKMIDFLSPEIITLGTIAIHFPDLVLEQIIKTAEEEALEHLFQKTKIMPAKLGNKLGDVSSLSASINTARNTTQNIGPSANSHLRSLIRLSEKIYNDQELLKSINDASVHIIETLDNGGKILTAGNGGSATDASHLAEELVGRYRETRKPLPAIHLGADAGAVTCIANDFGFDEIFSRQVEAFGEWGDLLVVFSTSGNSPNILKALDTAKRKKVFTIALLGKDGGEAAKTADHSIIVPHTETSRIQEIHTLILHCICESCDHFFTSK